MVEPMRIDFPKTSVGTRAVQHRAGTALYRRPTHTETDSRRKKPTPTHA